MTKSPIQKRSTRRAVIKGLGVAGLAAAALTASASFLSPSTSEVLAAVARHKAAWQAFGENCWRTDELDPRYVLADAEKNQAIWDAANKADYAAFDQFMEVRPQTPDDMKAKAEYLLSRVRRGHYVSEENWEAFLGAML